MNEREHQPGENSRDNSPYLIPFAVVIAGAMVAGAVIWSRGGAPAGQSALVRDSAAGNRSGTDATPPAVENIRPVTPNDHLRGNPEAAVKIVEFSDVECPFCKRFHTTMQQVMAEFGKKGEVAWVYRHFPLDSIHPKARTEAEATECAGALGGNEAFWAYTDRIFEITPSNNNLNLIQLPQIAAELGLDRGEFEQCLTIATERYGQRIEADYQDAVNSGGTGTPHSIVIAKSGKKFVISGAQPYEVVKRIVELALKEQ